MCAELGEERETEKIQITRSGMEVKGLRKFRNIENSAEESEKISGIHECDSFNRLTKVTGKDIVSTYIYDENGFRRSKAEIYTY